MCKCQICIIQPPEGLSAEHHCDEAIGHSDRLTVSAEHHVVIKVTWTPTHPGKLHETLQLAWQQEQLAVVLVGRATAPAQSALMNAAVKRSVSDITSTPIKACPCFPETTTGQKVIKSQRVGGISPGQPTFEAAMRNSTAATPNRRRPGDTAGTSRYGTEAAADTAAAPAFEARLQEMSDSPKPALPQRPRTRLKRAAGTVPLRSLRLSVNQQEEPARHSGPSAKEGSAKALGKAAMDGKSQAESTKGFSFFHSGYAACQ